jgi:hypothetical protein
MKSAGSMPAKPGSSESAASRRLLGRSRRYRWGRRSYNYEWTAIWVSFLKSARFPVRSSVCSVFGAQHTEERTGNWAIVKSTNPIAVHHRHSGMGAPKVSTASLRWESPSLAEKSK